MLKNGKNIRGDLACDDTHFVLNTNFILGNNQFQNRKYNFRKVYRLIEGCVQGINYFLGLYFLLLEIKFLGKLYHYK